MTSVTWLHLSDLHVEGNESAAQRGYLRDMRENIKSLLVQEGLTVDAVFFTADAAYSGTEAQYNLVTGWIDEMLSCLGLEGMRERVYLVPGNHDIDRKVIDKSDPLLQYHKDLVKGLLKKEDCGGIDSFLKNPADREWAFEKKFCGFRKFYNEFYTGTDEKLDGGRYYTVRGLKKGDHSISIIGLNSAWLSYKDNEQGRICLGERQICDAIEESR